MGHSFSIGKKLKFSLPGILFVFFLCNMVFVSIALRLVGTTLSHVFYYIVFFCLFMLSLVRKRFNPLKMPLVVYTTVALIFLLTYFIHPEYSGWFNHPYYGILPALVDPRSGIWGFVVFWMVKDEKNLIQYVKLSAWILFLYLMLKYVMVVRKGYWELTNIEGEALRLTYNLEFGYDMLFPVSFFGAYAYLKKKKLYYIPYAIGVFAILTRASRGALIWPVAMFFFMIPFHWRSLTPKNRFFYGLFLTLFLFIVLVCVFFMDRVLYVLSGIVSRFGISSRTIDSIVNGSFTDGNGREMIYEMAIDLIKTGGPFGWGAYGDRYVIGRTFMWGYSHNFFLECFVTFGYVGGSIVCGLFILGVIRAYKRCGTIDRQVVFTVFLTTAMKLMLSNSFWYMDAFWILLAIVLGWKRKRDSFFALEKGCNVIINLGNASGNLS